MLLVHPGGPFWAQRDDGAWSIPKGGSEDGEEDLRHSALRELSEELGPAPEIELEAMVELGTVRQKGGKVVHAWAAQGEFDPGISTATPFGWSGRRVRVTSASSLRSTGPSGSTPTRRGES